MTAILPANRGTTPEGMPQRPVLRYFGGKSRLAGWTVPRKATTTHLSRARVECLWLNAAASAALEHGPLFGGG